jgi:hypothetical protein
LSPSRDEKLSKGGVVVDGWTGAAATVSRTLDSDRGARLIRSYRMLQEHGSPVCLSFHTTEIEKCECGLAAGIGEAREDASLKSHF